MHILQGPPGPKGQKGETVGLDKVCKIFTTKFIDFINTITLFQMRKQFDYIVKYLGLQLQSCCNKGMME